MRIVLEVSKEFRLWLEIYTVPASLHLSKQQIQSFHIISQWFKDKDLITKQLNVRLCYYHMHSCSRILSPFFLGRNDSPTAPRMLHNACVLSSPAKCHRNS